MTEKKRRLIVKRQLKQPDDRYGIALLGLMVTLLLLGFSGDGRGIRLLIAALLDATLYFILQTSGVKRRFLRIALIAIGVSLALAVAESLLFTHHKPIATYAVLGALALATPVFVVIRILRHSNVTLSTLVGAVVVYILIGIAFTFLLVCGSLIDGPGFINGAKGMSTDHVYLSFITMTTVGFGDLTPGTNLARMIIIFEAVMSTLFLATVIARFASLFSNTGPVAEGAELEDAVHDLFEEDVVIEEAPEDGPPSEP